MGYKYGLWWSIIRCNHVFVNYIGTDPCIPTYDGLQGILNDFGNTHNTYQLHRQGSETFIPEDESLDFVFTSPHYFGWEAYGDEPEQSSIKFSTSDMWKEKFLKQTIVNVIKVLKLANILHSMLLIQNNIKHLKKIQFHLRKK